MFDFGSFTLAGIMLLVSMAVKELIKVFFCLTLGCCWKVVYGYVL